MIAKKMTVTRLRGEGSGLNGGGREFSASCRRDQVGNTWQQAELSMGYSIPGTGLESGAMAGIAHECKESKGVECLFRALDGIDWCGIGNI